MFATFRAKTDVGLVGAVRVAIRLLTVLLPIILRAQTNCTPVPPGIVSWWRAEGNALDWVGTNDGMIEGDVTYGLGEVGQAFVFSGYQCGIQIGAPSNLQLQNFTIEAWVRRATNTVTTLDTTYGPLPAYIYGSLGSCGLGMYDDGTLMLIDNRNDAEVDSSVGITNTFWHHVAVTKIETNVVFYIDGNPNPTSPYSDTFIYQGGATIGCANDYLLYSFYGSIDELSIYNRALSISEIQAIYNAGSAGKCTTPTGPPTIISQPSSQTVVIGDPVTFASSATSIGPEGYQWSLNGTNIDGATNSALRLADVRFDQAGTYAVTVTNAYGPTTSSNAVLTVLPTPPCVAVPSGLISWWRGEGNTIDRIGGNNGTLEGGAGYAVGKVGQAFSIAGDASAVTVGNATNLQLQNFTVECWMHLTDASLLATEDGSGSGYFFAFGEGGYGFGMSDDGGLFLTQIGAGIIYASAGILDTNFHHVAVTESDSNVVFYMDGAAYPAGVLATTYTFTTRAAIGARGDTLVNSFLGVVDELSIYDRALSAAEIGSIYGARSSGKCVAAIPVIAAQPVSQTVTAYSPAYFIVFADGPEPLLYQWTLDGTNIGGATNSTLSFAAVLPSNAGTYSVIVGTPPNTINSSNAVLTVLLPTAPTILTQPASHIGVVDDYTTFTVVAQSQAPVPMSYQWSWDGTNLTDATNSELVISNLTVGNAGTYAVLVFNPFFASNSQPEILTMIPAPTGTNRIVANLDPNELTRAVLAGGSVSFVCSGTITLTQAIAVGRDVVVEGSNTIAFAGGGRSQSQILAIPLGVNVTLRDLVLEDGVSSHGGAVSNGGVLSVSNVTFTGNYVVAMGGAIYNTGTLSLTNVIFSGNSAIEGSISCGGAICNEGGTVNLQDVTFDDNVAQGASPVGPFVDQGWGFGGALYSSGGSISGKGIECTNNAALSGNGYATGPFSPFGEPGDGQGGAFYLTNCIAVLSDSWFVSNATECSTALNEPQVEPEGGALFNAGWTVLTGVNFISNNCPGNDGADGNTLAGGYGGENTGGPGAGGIGGAIYNMGLLAMTNCTLTDNFVTAGSGGAGNICYPCNPITTAPSGPPGNALGGALANFGTIIIVSNAFLDNSATGPGTNVGTIYNVGNFQIDTNTTISPDTVDSNPGAFAAFLVLEPQSQIVAAGSTVTFTALAVGSPDPTYQWSWDATNLATSTATTLVLTNVQPGQSGTYSVEATNSVGSEISAAVLTVLAAPITLTGSSLGSAGFSISGTGVPGINCVIEVSTNLLEWQPLATNPSPFTFIDTNTSTFTSRYYRAVVTQ
jgi:hypothetical protein